MDANGDKKCVVTIIWATANLLRHRHKRTLLSLGLGTAIHGIAGMWSSSAALSGVDGALPGTESVCSLDDQEPGGEGLKRCMEFAAWFHALIFIYLGFLFVFGYVSFFMCSRNRNDLMEYDH